MFFSLGHMSRRIRIRLPITQKHVFLPEHTFDVTDFQKKVQLSSYVFFACFFFFNLKNMSRSLFCRPD